MLEGRHVMFWQMSKMQAGAQIKKELDCQFNILYGRACARESDLHILYYVRHVVIKVTTR